MEFSCRLHYIVVLLSGNETNNAYIHGRNGACGLRSD